MGVVPATDTKADSNRLVWVVNILEPEAGFTDEDYTFEERYKNKKIVVPPREKKAVLMKFIKAKHFLGQATGINAPFPYGGYVQDKNTEDAFVDKARFGKPLKIIELTQEEKELLEGLSEQEAMEKWQGKGKPQAPKKSAKKRAELADIPR